MALKIEVLDGEDGWIFAEPLDRECYPPEVMATIVWREVVWAHADKRVLVRLGGDIVCHAGLYFRDARSGGVPVFVGGVGGVMTAPRARRKGCAGAALRRAAEIMSGAGCDFGLLFCEPDVVGFYESLGWQMFDGDVFCEQPSGRVAFDMMHALVLPLRAAPGGGAVDLCGLPW